MIKILVIDLMLITVYSNYLVPDLRKWNNGKKAEEHDRVKHGVSEFNV